MSASLLDWRGDATLYCSAAIRARERWAGLWDFPRLTLLEGEAADSTGQVEPRQIIEAFRSELGIEIKHPRLFHELKHTVTRYRIRLLCYDATVAAADIRRLQGEWQQFALEELEDLPLTATARRIARVLQVKGLKS